MVVGGVSVAADRPTIGQRCWLAIRPEHIVLAPRGAADMALLTGIVGILAGLFVLRHPLVAALTVPTVLVIILGIQGLVMGILQIVGGFKGGGIGAFILGAINILVGILLLGSPMAAALAVPIAFGVLLLVQGVGLIILAFHVRT
jgi:uncharacterized membrane protein HdeD (DUF308 family)